MIEYTTPTEWDKMPVSKPLYDAQGVILSELAAHSKEVIPGLEDICRQAAALAREDQERAHMVGDGKEVPLIESRSCALDLTLLGER